MTVAGTPARMANMEQMQNTPNFLGIAPEEIKRVLLQDGWHIVKDCAFTHYAIGERHSPVTPNKYYPALSWTEGSNNFIVPLNKVQAVDYKSPETTR